MSKNLAFDTLNMLDLFGMGIDVNELIFHIPHSNNFIPDYRGYNLTKDFNTNINELTDWATDKIFDVENSTKLIAQFSRFFCDVERFADDNVEPMFKKGQGFFYTNLSNGKLLRTDIDDVKKYVYNNYYLKHHNKLNALTKDKLDKYGKAIIIDCHSFNENLLNTKYDNMPDICIGTDNYHTPTYLLEYVKNYLKNLNYSVDVNKPFAGTMIPNDYYNTNPNVHGIMIEINKKLYMNKNEVINDNVQKLNQIINNLFN